MEKFINNLYSNSNFPIILFSLIGIFIVLFIITLILALRDAKKYSKEEELESKKTDDLEVKEESPKEEQEETHFEDITFNEEEKPKEDETTFDGISFDDKNLDDDKDTKDDEDTKEEVIEETTTEIPVLKDEEISNFEEFFLENLKDKKDNVFDFSKIEDKKATEKLENNELDFNSDIEMELPKKKTDYSFKNIDGESYKINK